jgi:hypothetical protein
MWFVLASKAPKELTVDLSEAEVRSYNARIVENHHEQLYASTKSPLTEWISSQNCETQDPETGADVKFS